MKCPYCDFDNVLGSANCQECGQDLTGLEGEFDPTGRLKCVLLGNLEGVGVLPPIILEPEDTVALAVERMRHFRHGSVLIKDEKDKLIGIFTERDLYTRLQPMMDLAEAKLKDFMTPHPYCYPKDATVCHALNGMAVRGNRHLPIIDEHKLIGFLSVRKLLAHIAEKTGL